MATSWDPDRIRREILAEVRAETGFDLDARMALPSSRETRDKNRAEDDRFRRAILAAIKSTTGNDLNAPPPAWQGLSA